MIIMHCCVVLSMCFVDNLLRYRIKQISYLLKIYISNYAGIVNDNNDKLKFIQ